jgi:hypothetical protein
MRKHWRELTIEAADLGIKNVRIVFGSKHAKLLGFFNGKQIKFTVAGTPSDVRDRQNRRCKLKRYLACFQPPSA